MQVIPGYPTQTDWRGAVAALGNFDGVHRGHQVVLAHARALSRSLGAPFAVIVFEPHPRRYFQPHALPFRLQSPAQRAAALAVLGADLLFELPFDEAIAGCSAEAFTRDILCERLGLAAVVVGTDFRFGKGRSGDSAALARFGAALGLQVQAAPVLESAGEKVSSTSIRTALVEGRMTDAATLLTRPWAIEGTVEQGAQRGRTIGFPTANVPLGAYQRPAYGVYAVQVRGAFGRKPGVANIGVKPTVGGAPAPLLEAHLFDFEGDLYGATLEAALLDFIRPEQRFESLEALTRQIALDAETARRLLQSPDNALAGLG